jgi:hypothetical protein
VNHPGRVGRDESAGDVTADPQRVGQRHRPGGDPARQRDPIDKLHRDELETLTAAEIEGPGDIGVRHPARQLDLPTEALDRRRVARDLGAQRLQGDHLVELEVARPVHRPHAALAEQRLDLVAVRDLRALHERRGVAAGVRRGRIGWRDQGAIEGAWHAGETAVAAENDDGQPATGERPGLKLRRPSGASGSCPCWRRRSRPRPARGRAAGCDVRGRGIRARYAGVRGSVKPPRRAVARAYLFS